MKKLLLPGILATAGLLASQAFSHPVVYRDGELNFENGAVVTADGEAQYYSRIRLIHEADGEFDVAAAEPRDLVTVNDVTIVDALPPVVDIAVQGSLSVPCVELLPAAVSLKDNTFTVVLAESEQDGICAQVIEPFDTVFSLDVSGLDTGASYTVLVNGVEAEFSL